MLGLILPVRQKPQPRSDKEGFKDMYFKGQQVNEDLICFCRKHWMQALSHIGLWILFAIAESFLFFGVRRISGIIAGNFGLQILYVGVVILMTVYLHKTFFRFFSYFLSTVIFTSTRVVLHKKTLFLTDSHEVLDVTKIQDVKKSTELRRSGHNTCFGKSFSFAHLCSKCEFPFQMSIKDKKGCNFKRKAPKSPAGRGQRIGVFFREKV